MAAGSRQEFEEARTSARLLAAISGFIALVALLRGCTMPLSLDYVDGPATRAFRTVSLVVGCANAAVVVSVMACADRWPKVMFIVALATILLSLGSCFGAPHALRAAGIEDPW